MNSEENSTRYLPKLQAFYGRASTSNGLSRTILWNVLRLECLKAPLNQNEKRCWGGGHCQKEACGGMIWCIYSSVIKSSSSQWCVQDDQALSVCNIYFWFSHNYQLSMFTCYMSAKRWLDRNSFLLFNQKTLINVTYSFRLNTKKEVQFSLKIRLCR